MSEEGALQRLRKRIYLSFLFSCWACVFVLRAILMLFIGRTQPLKKIVKYQLVS